jgi:hypothetical protein
MRSAGLLFVLALLAGTPQKLLAEDGTAITAAEQSIAKGAFSSGVSIPAWIDDVPLPPEDKSRPLVERLGDTQYLIGKEITTFVHQAFTANDASTLSSLGELQFEFVPEYQKLDLYYIRIWRNGEKLDRTASSKVRFVGPENMSNGNGYTDVVIASVLVEDLRVGDTVEFAYATTGQNPVFDGKFISRSGWDQNIPISLRRVSLRYPTSRSISWRFNGSVARKNVEPKESIVHNLRQLTFEQAGVPEVVDEQSLPRGYQPYNWLQFSEFRDWTEVARWASKQFETNAGGEDAVAKIADRVRSEKSAEESVTRVRILPVRDTLLRGRARRAYAQANGAGACLAKTLRRLQG